MMRKDDLIQFEKQVAELYEQGKIFAPIHLRDGGEDTLIEIFQGIKRTDMVLGAWRSHLHALLHGISPEEVMRQILAGRSMTLSSINPWLYCSAIAGGILPIAVGLGMAIKQKGEHRWVHVFVGDMVACMGIFFESVRYARNFDLPVRFIIENNGKSVQTPTEKVWGGVPDWSYFYPNISTYEYNLTWPHSGVGKWVAF